MRYFSEEGTIICVTVSRNQSRKCCFYSVYFKNWLLCAYWCFSCSCANVVYLLD